MSGVHDEAPLSIKFRLIDGFDIGPRIFTTDTSVESLKKTLIDSWPKEKKNGPNSVKDVKLISAGKILGNSQTAGECRVPLVDNSEVIMHVVVHPSSGDKATEKLKEESKKGKCACVIL